MIIKHKSTGASLFNGPVTALRGADLRGADLMGADLTEADLRGASMIGHERTPEQQQLLTAVAVAALATQDALEMGDVHTCNTTHCIAGWACTLAPNGVTLENDLGWFEAGRALLGLEAASYFFAGNKKARDFW